jgi:hypothetical protein
MRVAAICALAALLARAHPAVASVPPPERRPDVRHTPGYVPLVDPDSAAERLGRRPNAPLVSMPFRVGARSLDALGRAVCGALHGDTPDSLLRLCVDEREFRDILWPEFPQSRPATGLRWEDAWPVLWGRLNGGSVSATRELASHVYTLLRVERTATTRRFRNFRLHEGLVLVVKDEEGREQRFDWIRAVAERRGRFKIYSMRD